MSSALTPGLRKLAAVLALGCVTISGIPGASAAPASVSAAARRHLRGRVRRQDGFEAEALRLTNEARAHSRKCGGKRMKAVRPLSWSPVLAAPADAHSADMANNDYFSHYRTRGSPFERMRAAGYSYRAAGENIAAGRSLPPGRSREGVAQQPRPLQGHHERQVQGTRRRPGRGPRKVRRLLHAELRQAQVGGPHWPIASVRSGLSYPVSSPGSLHVIGHLDYQRLHRVEAQRWPEPLDELDVRPLAVHVVVLGGVETNASTLRVSPSNVGLVPTEMAAGLQIACSPSTRKRPAYTPSPGTAIESGTSTLAVG